LIGIFVVSYVRYWLPQPSCLWTVDLIQQED